MLVYGQNIFSLRILVWIELGFVNISLVDLAAESVIDPEAGTGRVL